MKKGLSLILTAVFLTAMLMVGGMSALAAGEADPEDAKSVLDLSYLTKDQALDGSAGAAVYQDQAFDNSKLKLSCVTVDGKDWLKYEYGAWFNGLLVDLNTAKGQDPAKGVTDWTGATMVWFMWMPKTGPHWTCSCGPSKARTPGSSPARTRA